VIISQVELSSFYCKLTQKSMFPVLYDSASPRVYEGGSQFLEAFLLRDFATPAAGTVPAGTAWRPGLFGACFATAPDAKSEPKRSIADR